VKIRIGYLPSVTFCPCVKHEDIQGSGGTAPFILNVGTNDHSLQWTTALKASVTVLHKPVSNAFYDVMSVFCALFLQNAFISQELTGMKL
jgi:hypothetical protein